MMMLIHGRLETGNRCDKSHRASTNHALHDDKGGSACFDSGPESGMHHIAALGPLVAVLQRREGGGGGGEGRAEERPPSSPPATSVQGLHAGNRSLGV